MMGSPSLGLRVEPNRTFHVRSPSDTVMVVSTGVSTENRTMAASGTAGFGFGSTMGKVRNSAPKGIEMKAVNSRKKYDDLFTIWIS